MSDPGLDTIVLQDCLDRWRAGEKGAADDLLRRAGARLEKLARRMTRSFPNVRGMVDADDILQNSTIRFLRTLLTLRPTSTRDFFNLAAVHIRRELLDIARSAKNKRTVQLDPTDSSVATPPEPIAPQDAGPESDKWVRFHEAVEELPVEEREVVGLVFYHGWTQDKIAELFQVDERTIRRRWASACQRLRETAGVAPEE
ncbi:MAG: sigma-70 family RNA polymerase sigma factor [Planctomycetes bacterium]|nr:sigma-70 family RNA polymerase sigma factor [Planctomycetota bacterium]